MRTVFAFLLSALALAACGGRSDDPPAQLASQDLVTATSDLVAARCNQMAQCQPENFQLNYGGNLASCIGVGSPEHIPVLVAPGTGATAENVEACAQAIVAAGCAPLTGAASAACDFHGTVPNGGACVEDPQCGVGSFCTGARTAACGTCAPAATAGQSCLTVGCASGLACFGDGSTLHCVAPVALGGACDGQLCESDVCSGGTCVAPLELGATCDPQQDGCDVNQELYCAASPSGSGTCVQITLAAVGQPCGVPDDVQISCAGIGVGVTCVYPSSSDPSAAVGTCVAAIADGQPCGGSTVGSCIAPSKCESGVCTPLAAAACP